MTTTTLAFLTITVITAIFLVIIGFAVCIICGNIDDCKDETDKRLDKIEHDVQSVCSHIEREQLREETLRESSFNWQNQEIRVRLLTGLLTMMRKGGAE